MNFNDHQYTQSPYTTTMTSTSIISDYDMYYPNMLPYVMHPNGTIHASMLLSTQALTQPIHLQFNSIFSQNYQRVNKRTGKKNLRCFPECSISGHVGNGVSI